MEKSYSLVISNENPKQILPNTPISTAFKIGYDRGKTFRIQGIQIRYKAGLDRVVISFLDTGSGKKLIEGNTQLCQIGNRQDAAIPRDELPVDIYIKSGTSVEVSLATITETIDPKDVSVSLFGNEVVLKA